MFSEQIKSLFHYDSVYAIEILLSSRIAHAAYRSNAPDCNSQLIIRDSDLTNFICLTLIKKSRTIPVTSQGVQYKLVRKFVKTESDFKGVYGSVDRIAGQR